MWWSGQELVKVRPKVRSAQISVLSPFVVFNVLCIVCRKVRRTIAYGEQSVQLKAANKISDLLEWR